MSFERILENFYPKLGSSISTIAKYPIVAAMGIVLARPALAYRINQRLMRYPSLHRRLQSIASSSGLIEQLPERTASPSEADLSHVTARTRRIYGELKAAVERQRRRAN